MVQKNINGIVSSLDPNSVVFSPSLTKINTVVEKKNKICDCYHNFARIMHTG